MRETHAVRPESTRELDNRRKHTPLMAIVVALIVLTIGAGIVFAYSYLSQDKVVPKSLAKQMNFPIYYPDPKKLPSGYTLNTRSFSSPVQNVVLYRVQYNGGALIFSVQPKPSANDLALFNSQRIPLHTTLQTSVGKAVIGAIGNQSVVSLPTNSRAWIIVTGPYATDQNKLADVLKVIRPPR